MEDIKLLILGEKWEEAVRAISHSNYTLPRVIESILEDQFMNFSEAVILLKQALSYGYLQEHHNYEE